jgi:hypothetical protein
MYAGIGGIGNRASGGGGEVSQILQAIHDALTQAIARIKRAFKKPPLLEGDINFVELEHPEFIYIRLPDEDGVPCLASETPFGEVYICAMPKMKEEEVERPEQIYRFFSPEMFICNEFRLDGAREKFCSHPCLQPERPGGYQASVGIVRRGDVEWHETVTEFGAGALSQITEIKQIVMGGGYDKSALRNIVKAVVANIRQFLGRHPDLCAPDRRKETNEYLSSFWVNLVNAVGEEVLYELGFDKMDFSCDTTSPKRVVKTPGIANPTGSFEDMVSLLRTFWSPKYDDREFYKWLLARTLAKRQKGEAAERPERPIKHVPREVIDEVDIDSLYRFTQEECDKHFRNMGGSLEICAAWADMRETRNWLINTIYSTIMDPSRRFSLDDLVKAGYMSREQRDRIMQLEKAISEMKRARPAPGKEEEFQEELRGYEDELKKLYEIARKANSNYAYDLSEGILRKSGRELRKLCEGGGDKRSPESDGACYALYEMEIFCEVYPQVCMTVAREKRGEARK